MSLIVNRHDKAPHGCPDMVQALERSDIPVEYDDRFREHSIIVIGGRALQTITHCPWCGEKLPSSLRDEWFEQLRALGFELGDEGIPPQMRSGEWWRAL